jgi:flavin-dependent dehydrogenase
VVSLSPLSVLSFERVCVGYQVVVCADGAPSKMAIQLGIVTEPPSSSCSRAYVEGGTHKFKADGVVFYPQGLLPGYAALFRHPNDELNYCVYIIPGNPKVTDEDLSAWHKKLMTDDPYISKALGPDFKIEPMKAGQSVLPLAAWLLTVNAND